MKKVVFLFTVYSSLFTGAVFAYTQDDVSNAQFLADKGIIVKQSTTAGYRLDNTITRAELVGIALKLKGVTLPSYQCKGYFIDVRNNDWICRAVEISADHGLVTRANARFRAQDNITRAEALAIVTRDIEDLPNSYQDPTNYIDANTWQIKVIQKAIAQGIISPEIVFGKDMGGMFAGFKEKNVYFYPNRSATRAEVFGFARNTINARSQVKVNFPDAEKIGDTWKYNSSSLYAGKYNCELMPSSQFRSSSLEGFLNAAKLESAPVGIFNTNKGVTGLYTVSEMAGSGGKILFFTGATTYELRWIGDSKVSGPEHCMSYVDGLYTKDVSSTQLLKIYYQNIGISWDKNTAYSMRSPAGVSLETFQSWYKNVTNVVFREDTIKDLGDNTYEFLVNMTENGVVSTYKVTSKVDLENFTINNLSSVKQ